MDDFWNTVWDSLAEVWDWFGIKENRDRATAIAQVVATLLAVLAGVWAFFKFVIPRLIGRRSAGPEEPAIQPHPVVSLPTGEPLMSMPRSVFEAELNKRAAEVEAALATASEDERAQLEGQRAVIARRLADVEGSLKEREANEPEGPIEWYFNDEPTIFGWNDANDGTFLVGTFNIRGRNVSDEPIVNVESYVRPQVTTEDIMLQFYHPREHNLLDTKNYMIQPGAEFQLSYKIPPYDRDKTPQGVPVDRFLSEYGGIRFIFVYNDAAKIIHDFPYEQIRAYLFEMLDRHARRRTAPPDIRRI